MTSNPPVTDYANLPLIEGHRLNTMLQQQQQQHICQPSMYVASASQPYAPSSMSETPRSDLSFGRDHASLASDSSQESLRSSTLTPTAGVQPACNAAALVEPGRVQKWAPPVPPKRRTRRDELNEQLDRLERKGTAMTETDQRLYRLLVNELAKIRLPVPSPLLPPKPALGRPAQEQSDRHSSEPLMSEGRRSETPQSDTSINSGEIIKRPQGLFPDPSELAMTSSVTVRQDDPGDKQELNVNGKAPATDISLVHKNGTVEGAEKSDMVMKKTALLPPKEDDAGLKKKSVQWGDSSDVREAESAQRDSKLIYEDEEEAEPRVQVLGAQEVYRDPRQRRLEEMRARQNAAVSKIDGSKLGFRDKMQLFAEQIGDKTVKNRYKASAIQREIEQTMGDDP